MRYFNGRPVELLAPAGNFAIFKEVINAGCDAVYCGGKRFNMRLHRKDFNFSEAELAAALELAHEQGKKVYITVNNMYREEDLPRLEEYLVFLSELKPDAILVQDFAVPALLQKLGLTLTMHASVMMNVHNLETIKRLEENGFSRVVLSRELPLSYVRAAAALSNIEFEYFVHGDMCVAHGGQCLYSGMIFGSSSNQGRCLKPCRWDFKIERGARRYATSFPLAVKDMYLYEHIPELIHHRVSCFKIEGRMREAAYLVPLINAYGSAIDRYIEDPLAYDRRKDAGFLYQNRKRDFSTAYAFGRPGLANINRRMEGTGAFYSTGKVFSTASEEPELSDEKIGAIRETLRRFLESRAGRTTDCHRALELACKVQNLEQARYCVERGVDHVYLSGEVFLPEKPFSTGAIRELLEHRGKTKIWLCQGRMMFDQELEEFLAALEKLDGLDGLLVSSLGGLSAASNIRKNLACRGDYGLNIQNSFSWQYYRNHGLEGFTISPETKPGDTLALLDALASGGAQIPGQDAAVNQNAAELIVFGSPTVMYLEHDLFENTDACGANDNAGACNANDDAIGDTAIGNASDNAIGDTAIGNASDKAGGAETLSLIDEKGFRHPVFRDSSRGLDSRGRNHVLLVKDLSLLPFAGELVSAGLRRARVEASYLPAEQFRRVVELCLSVRDQPENAAALVRDFTPPRLGLSAGPWTFTGSEE
ncbi:MAG: U32 family peptidase [Spirochaetaceae bacterium]|jgi:putative protease|nr:U32 family peptidase [Spirochaetaceae bacterium]